MQYFQKRQIFLVYRCKLNLLMLCPRLNDLNIVQEPSSFPPCFLSLSPASSALLSPFPREHWARPARCMCQFTVPLAFPVCAVLFTLAISCSKGPRTHEEVGVRCEISPAQFCTERDLSCCTGDGKMRALWLLSASPAHQTVGLSHTGQTCQTPDCPESCVCLRVPV